MSIRTKHIIIALLSAVALASGFALRRHLA